MAKFRISGEFITNHVRGLWSEQDFNGAFKYLSSTIPDMNRGQQLDLVEGRMKLVGIEDLDFIEDTDFIKDDEYSTLEDALDRKKDSDKLYNEKYDNDYKLGLEIIYIFTNYYNHSLTNTPYEDLITKWDLLLNDVKSKLITRVPYYMSTYLRSINGIKYPHIGLTHYTIAVNNFHEKAWTDKKIYHQYCDEYFIYGTEERDEIWEEYHILSELYSRPLSVDEQDVVETPKKKELNKDFSMRSAYGWLSREGTYYPCYYTGHTKLAEDICDKFDWDYEKDASITLENKGWVKIHTPDDYRKGITLFAYIKEPNNTQINKIIKYCDTRKIIYPEFVK